MNFIKIILYQVEDTNGECTTSQTNKTEATIADPEEMFHIAGMCVQLNALLQTGRTRRFGCAIMLFGEKALNGDKENT